MTFRADEAQFLLEGYASGSPQTDVDEWDVALVSRNNERYIVARGYKDARGPDGSLLDADRVATMDVVSTVGGGQVFIEAPNSDEPKALGAAQEAAVRADFGDLTAALNLQASLGEEAEGTSTAKGAGSALRPAANAMLVRCAKESELASKALDKARSTPLTRSAPPSRITLPLGSATHACAAIPSRVAQSHPEAKSLNEMLSGSRGVKRFFERNRTLLAPYFKRGTHELVGLLKCLLSQVKGIYAFGEFETPLGSVTSAVAKRSGIALPSETLSAALKTVPGLDTAPSVSLLLAGGLELETGEKFGAVGVFHDLFDFRVPIVGLDAHTSLGVVLPYNFHARAWGAPIWEADAGTIPFWAGAPLGLSVFVSNHDALGIIIDTHLRISGERARAGVIIELSRASLGAFWAQVNAGTFVNGCHAEGGH